MEATDLAADSYERVIHQVLLVQQDWGDAHER